MADAQKAESTPSPDTEGVRLAEKLDAIARDMDRAVGGGMMWINLDEEREFAGRIRRVAAALRTAQNTGRDEVLEALTPSAETKAAYMGEFSFVIPQAQEDEHGEAIEVDQRVYVPWTTIKEIMAAIKTRALSSPPVSTVDEEGGGA